jgi:hypothetical protein
MAQPDSSDNRQEQSDNLALTEFLRALDNEHRMLVVLKAQLYGGNWEPMLDDLKNRLTGKPYIFKLASRIKDDIERIERMKAFEEKYHVDLADHVELV